MHKYHKQIITWSAVVLAALTLIFCFLPSAWQQYIRLRIDLFFSVPRDVDVKRIVFETGTLKDVCFQTGQNGILIHIKNNKTSIYINDYPYTNINFLKDYEFDSLSICETKITQIYPLKNSRLMSLNVICSPIKDISFVTGCDKLEVLYLADIQIRDLSPLKDLKGLKKIFFYARENTAAKIDVDLSPLAKLVKLESLSFSDVGINDLSPLKGLKRLRGLTIRNCVVGDFSVIVRLTDLEWLDLDNTDVSGMKSFSSLKKLKRLYLSNSNVKDLNPLVGLEGLEKLFLEDNPIEDLTPLKNLKNLTELYLNKTKVKDLSPLKNLGLEYLHIKDTPAAKLPLPEWTKSIHVTK